MCLAVSSSTKILMRELKELLFLIRQNFKTRGHLRLMGTSLTTEGKQITNLWNLAESMGSTREEVRFFLLIDFQIA